MNLAQKALAKGARKSAPEDQTPFKEALREAYDAMKNDDFDAFTDAFKAAVTIQLADDTPSSELDFEQ